MKVTQNAPKHAVNLVANSNNTTDGIGVIVDWTRWKNLQWNSNQNIYI